jgi:hypothetical protein
VRGRRSTPATAAPDANRPAGNAFPKTLTPRAYVAQPQHQFGLAPLVLLVVDIAQLELHLELHELLLDRRVVRQLFVDDLLDLAQRPFDAGHWAGDGEEKDVGEEAHSRD